MVPLSDAIVLVTGASSGIGRAIATCLAEAGSTVYATGRNATKLEQLAASNPQRIIPFAADLQRDADIDALFAEIEAQHDRLDVLVNNAGVGYKSSLIDGERDLWRKMLNLNVYALAVCTNAALKLMPGDKGHIVNIGSMAGHRVPAGGGMYSASKHAVRALTEGLRAELALRGSKVRVSEISPGIVETPFFDNYFLGDKKAAQEMVTKLKPLEPQDIARAVRFVIEAPAHVGINDVLMRSVEQAT